MHKLPIRSALLVAMLASSSFAFAAAPQQVAAPSTASTAPQQTARRADLFEQLGLTDTQRSSVRQLIQQNARQAAPEIQALRQKRMAFDNATPGSSQFKAAANDLAQAESTAARAQIQRQADLRTRIYELLTSAQRTKLANLLSERQQRMQQRRAANAPATSG